MNRLIGFLLIVIFVSVLYARSTYTGFTRKTSTTGCSCHGSASSTVTVTITGPDSLQAGSTGTYKVDISGGSGTRVATDIAVSKGTLISDGSTTKLSGDELITNGTKTFSGGKFTYSFSYTAPNTAGTETLYATGLSSTSSNQWNFAPDKKIKIVSSITSLKDEKTVSSEIELIQNYPNPFNPATIITYSLPRETKLTAEVIDINGRVVEKLFEGIRESGLHQIQWNAVNYSSGVYFFRLTSPTSVKVINMLLVR
jgi:hypothetical protein